MSYPPDIYQRIVSAKVYMDDNFPNTINLDDISRKAFLSRFHFHRLFSRIYRRTPHQYLTYMRLRAARQMLKQDADTITEVSNNVGFESATSFSLLFKKQNGCSPQYYRNMAWLKKKQAAEQPRKFVPHCFTQQFSIAKESNIR